MPIYLVDIQYYPYGKTRFLKEATLLEVETKIGQHFVLKPPFSYDKMNAKDQKTCQFIHEKLGVVHWNEGNHSIQDFISAVPGNSILMCNGSEKASILSRLLPHVYHIFDLHLSIEKGQKVCSFPAPHSLCSMANVIEIHKYFSDDYCE